MATAVRLFAVLAYACTLKTMPSNGFVSLNCLPENRGLHGMDSVIQCSVKSGYPTVRIVAVVWRKMGVSPPLMSFMGGVLKQSPRFQLAEPSWNESHAAVSLLVRATRVTDEGLYHCLVLTDQGLAEKTAHLQVTARYTGLIVSSVPESNIQDETAVEMFCSAQGGYPKGAIRWFDQYGRDWSRSAETVVRETADGRFDLVSKFAVRRVSSASPRYRCCLVNGAGDKEAEAELRLSFAVPGQEKAAAAIRSHKAITASVIVMGSLVCGFLVLVLLQRSEGCAAAQRRFDEEPVRVTDGYWRNWGESLQTPHTAQKGDYGTRRPDGAQGGRYLNWSAGPVPWKCDIVDAAYEL